MKVKELIKKLIETSLDNEVEIHSILGKKTTGNLNIICREGGDILISEKEK